MLLPPSEDAQAIAYDDFLTDESARVIAGAVLTKAVQDWKKYRWAKEDRYDAMYPANRPRTVQNARDLGFASVRKELMTFWVSDVFKTYCLILDMDPDWVLKSIGVCPDCLQSCNRHHDSASEYICKKCGKVYKVHTTLANNQVTLFKERA